MRAEPGGAAARRRASAWRCWRAAPVPAAGSDEARRLAKAFDVLVKAGRHRASSMANSTRDGSFAVPVMARLRNRGPGLDSATSITAAYALIKRLAQEFGRRPFGILVTGATEAEAKVVYDNMSAAASRYLAVNAEFDGLGAGRRIPAPCRAPGAHGGRCLPAGGGLGGVPPTGGALRAAGHAQSWSVRAAARILVLKKNNKYVHRQRESGQEPPADGARRW
jgi:hypothetical protein